MASPSVTVHAVRAGTTMLLPVRVNGVGPLWFVLDSGASGCVLDLRIARRLGIAPIGTRAGHGAGAGEVRFTRYDSSRVTFDVGGVRFRSDRLLGIDLSGQRTIIGHTVDGILGYDLMAHHVVEIDYAARRVRLHDPRTWRDPGAGAALPLALDGRLPHVLLRARVPGRPAELRRFLVDTGSEDGADDSLLVHSRGPLRTVRGGVGLGARYDVVLGTLASLRVGPYELRDVPGVAPGVQLIGGAVLSRFKVTLDYPHARMFVAPGPGFRAGG